MANTSKLKPVSDRDAFYYRQRYKNRIFEELTAFFAEEAERLNLTKKDIAEALQRDPAQITRWLSAPSNLTLDTISDLLLPLEAEMDSRIVRFADRPIPNYVHPLVQRAVPQKMQRATTSLKPPKEKPTPATTSTKPVRILQPEPA